MPNPISRVYPNASIMLSNVGDYPLSRHPNLAALAIEAISSWSNVESFMLHMFITMMGGPTDNAAAVYLALDSRSAKSAAINAIAEKTLSAENRRLLRAILRTIKSNGGARDKLAHWVWGDSPDIPDGLLLADPTKLARIEINTNQNALAENVFVYKRQDFEQIIKTNERLAGFGQLFGFILKGHIANQDGRLFDELCQEPEIRDMLDRPA